MQKSNHRVLAAGVLYANLGIMTTWSSNATAPSTFGEMPHPGRTSLSSFTINIATVADDAGSWSAYFSSEHAGGPYTLRITGDGPAITRADVLVGDVWLASGQSCVAIASDIAGTGSRHQGQQAAALRSCSS